MGLCILAAEVWEARSLTVSIYPARVVVRWVRRGVVMRKNIVTLSIFFLGVIVGVSFWQWQRVSPLTMQVLKQKIQFETLNKLELARISLLGATFNYGECQKHPVQLVVDRDDGRVVLQILHRRNEFMGGFVGRGMEELNYLKTQVETIVTEKKGIQLQNGMTLRFEGYPIWGPHSSFGPDGDAERLYFGESAIFDDKTIVVRGVPSKPVGYYPYTLSGM
jgi:hypothetical protein